VRTDRAAEEKKKTAPETVTAAPNQEATPMKETKTVTRAEAIENILLNMEKKMSAEDVKATLGDYIKLIQLAKEMKEESKTAMTVGWIEDPELIRIEE
jgi:hypothetical protein